MDEIDDRRGSGRVYIMSTVTLEIGDRTLEATALDLSVSGVSVWAPEGEPRPPALGIVMRLDDHGPLRVAGRVAREFESDGGSVWGIAFDGIGGADVGRLEAYLRTLE